MPAFYPPPHQQLPLTPPEYYHTSCGGMAYPQGGHAAQPGIRQDDGFDCAERYGQLAMAMPPMYPQAGTYLSNAPPAVPPHASSYYYGILDQPVLPPIRSGGASMSADAIAQLAHQRQHEQAQAEANRANPPKEEKAVGGVSAKLDYDMEDMTDFVCEVANGMYELAKTPLCLADIDIYRSIQRGKTPPASFRKWVHQVLCATRLPSATILLSMWYLQTRTTQCSVQSKQGELHLYRSLTIALILGSKFLDDNTFINRSWSEVSGIPVADLNHLEMEWLVAIDFKLHRDPTEEHGWCSWQENWKAFEAGAAVKANLANRLSPIDTGVQRQRGLNQNKPLPPLPIQQGYHQPPAYEYTPKSAQTPFGFGQYDPWRSTVDNSPASAPTTGPTTPEYYGGHQTWAAPDGYQRRSMFGFSQQPSSQSQQQHQSNYYASQYGPSAWNQHPINCGCMYCVQRHNPYLVAAV